MGRRNLRAGQGRERVEAPGDAARDQSREPERDNRRERVGRGRERLPGEDFAAVAASGQDRLQRPVVRLGGHDVAGDQRGDQRQAPD